MESRLKKFLFMRRKNKMEKKLKIQCIYLGVLVVMAAIIWIVAVMVPNLSEMQRGFVSGLGTSIFTFGGVLLVKNIMALRNPDKLRQREIEETDERNVHIYEKSMAITFRICLGIQALASIILVAMNNEWGVNLGLIAGGELLVFIICNVIIGKRS